MSQNSRIALVCNHNVQGFSPTVVLGQGLSGTLQVPCSDLPTHQPLWHWMLKAHSCSLLQRTGLSHCVQEWVCSLGGWGWGGEPVADDDTGTPILPLHLHVEPTHGAVHAPELPEPSWLSSFCCLLTPLSQWAPQIRSTRISAYKESHRKMMTKGLFWGFGQFAKIWWLSYFLFWF